MKWALFITLSLWGTAARAGDAEVCRVLLRHVVEKYGALGPDELRAFAGAPHGTSPVDLATFPNEPSRLPFTHAFRKFLDGPDGQAVADALRAEALRLADVNGAEKEKRDATRDDTARIAFPILLRKLQYEIGNPTFFTRDGKNFAAFGSGEDTLTILDLENLSETKFQVGMGPVRSAPFLFEHDGSDHLGIAGGIPALNGKAGLKIFRADGQPAALLPPEAVKASAGPLPIVIDGKLWLAANERSTNHLALVPVGQPGKAVRRLIDVTGPENFRMTTYSGAEGSLVAMTKRGGNWALVDPVKNTAEPIEGSFDSFVALHAHSGKARLFIAGPRGAVTVDPRGGPPESIPGAPADISQYFSRLVDGDTKALVMTNTHELHLIDLEKRHSRKVASVAPDTYATNYFRLAGHEYVVWAEYDGTLKILDLQKPAEIIERKLVQTMPFEIIPFPAGDGVNALVRMGSQSPGYVVQLVGKPNGSKP